MIGMNSANGGDHYAMGDSTGLTESNIYPHSQPHISKKLKMSASFELNDSSSSTAVLQGDSPLSSLKGKKPAGKRKIQSNGNHLSKAVDANYKLSSFGNSERNSNGIHNHLSPNRFALSLGKRVDFANQLLAATNRPPQANLVLNSFQLINFIEFYFNDLSTANSYSENGLMMHSSAPEAIAALNGDSSHQHATPSNMITNCFPCSACSTKFTFEQTFQMHLNRRSVLIRLYCLKCATYKTFFNKCKLFYHIYSHKLNLFEGMYTGLSIDVIPGEKSKEKASVDLGLLFQSINKMIAATTEKEGIEDLNGPDGQTITNGAATAALTGRFKMNQSDLFEVRRFVKTLLANRLVVYKCSICSALFFTNDDLRQHYQQTLNYELNLMQLQQQQHQQQQKLISNGHAVQNPQLSGSIKKIGTGLIYRNQIRILKQKVAVNNAAMIKNFANLLDMDLSQSQANQYFYDLLNKVSSKKLQFSTRCFQLATLNFINNFKLNSLCFQDPIVDYVSTSILLSKLGLSSNNNGIQSDSSSCSIEDPSIPPMPKITNGRSKFVHPAAPKRSPGSSNENLHQHGSTTPLTCPLCGLTFDPNTQIIPFKLHLLYVCNITLVFDLNLFKCPLKECLFVSESVSEFASHWLNKHVVRHHECLICEQQLGIKFTFEEESIEVCAKANGNNSASFEIPQQLQQSYANSIPLSIVNQDASTEQNEGVMTNRWHNQSPNLSMNITDSPPPAISNRLLTEINRHYFEHHRNLAVRLKVVYRCQCAELTSESCGNEFDKDSFLIDKDSSGSFGSCTFTDWRLCKKHVLYFVTNKYANFLKCLFCKKNVIAESFQMHLSQAHPNDKDSFFVCPICGFVKKNSSTNSSLHTHIMAEHPNTSLSKSPASCVFNLKTSMLETCSNGILLPSKDQQNMSKKSLATKRPSFATPSSDFDIYFCVSCRHFYPHDTSFSHSCWNDMDSETNGNHANGASNGTSTSASTVSPTTNSNYFSPIYLKLNLNKLLVPLNTHESKPMSTAQPQTYESEFVPQ